MTPIAIAQTLDDAYRMRQTINTRDRRHGKHPRKLVIKHVVGTLSEPTTFLVASLEPHEFEFLD